MEKLEFTESLSFVFNQTSTVYYARLEKKLSAAGLHYGQIFVLISLWKNDAQTQKELAEDIAVSAPTINKMVKSLAQAGFVKTRRDEQDTRAVRVTLTEKSNAVRPHVESLWRELENELLENLTETEKLIFLQILQKIKTNFD